jgi:hypothetical protein
MATIKIQNPPYWTDQPATPKHDSGTWNELVAFARNKSTHQEHWLKISLTAQAILFLPLAALLLVSYQAPLVATVAVFALFIANIFAGLAGSGIRAIASLFGMVVIDMLMFAMFVV